MLWIFCNIHRNIYYRALLLFRTILFIRIHNKEPRGNTIEGATHTKESYPHDPSSPGSIVTEGTLLEARHFLGARSVWRGKIPSLPDMDILVPLTTPSYHML